MFFNTEPTSDQNKYLKQLTWAAITVCVLSICLSLTYSIVCIRSLSGLLHCAEVINLTGRQRMLSQRITALAGIELDALPQSTPQPVISQGTTSTAIQQCAIEMKLGYARVQHLLTGFRDDPTLDFARSRLAKSEKHREELLIFTRRIGR